MELNFLNRKKLVMVIDDTLIDQFVAERMIKLYGFSENVIVFDSGIKALEYFSRQDLLEEDIPQVIFLDIRMPEMDGFEFLEEYANLSDELKSKMKVVMLTSSLDKNDYDRGLKNPYVMHFLNKPLDEDQLTKLSHM
ncbi:MAG TPA: response regulator [Bacteroidia bacterium]|jgi:CheY-like chemotaxis protein|nr:response regulator [Bacteroidia bacterium]HQF28767.1 response regulator [Bacteroidia bacterium]HQK96981.1 response regulator [Bacteroidia bacterium]